MPPFQYSDYHNPYVGSIAELMMAGPNAHARAAEASGQVWGRTISNIGEAIGNIPAQVQHQKVQQQEQQIREQQIAENAANLKRQADVKAGKDALAAAIKQFTTADPKNGRAVTDYEKVSQAVSAAGFPDQGQSYLKMAADNAESLDKLHESTLSHGRQQLATIGDLAYTAKSPQDFISGLGLATTSQLVDEATAHKLADDATGDGWQAMKERYQQFSPKWQKLNEPVKLGEGEKLTVPATGQVLATGGEKPKSEWETFTGSYAKSLGKQTWNELSPHEQMSGFHEFTVSKQDPALASLLKESQQLRIAMEKAQLGQQPTKEDATLIADLIDTHKMAPSQLTLFGGMGAAGAAFKRMVGTELVKKNPEFNWEQAESDYQFAKSPGFQNTVRYMDAVVESIPRLQQNATKLANGKFKSWNALKNAAAAEFNSADVKALKTDVLLVGDEVAKILQGGGSGSATSDAKLKQAAEIFSTSDDVPAIVAAVDEVQYLIGNRRNTLTRGTFAEHREPPAPAKAAPVAATPKLGDVVTVKGQRIRVTKIGADGQFEGMPVP